MVTFREAEPATQTLIDHGSQLSPKKLRSLLGAGAGAFGELIAEATYTRRPGEAIERSAPRPKWAEGGEILWKGSVKLTIDDVMLLARAGQNRATDDSVVIAIGGPLTTITGNLEIYDDSLIFGPHDSWRKRGIDYVRIRTDLPIEYSGITDGQSGRRALAVSVAPSATMVVFRLGMLIGDLGELIATRRAPL